VSANDDHTVCHVCPRIDVECCRNAYGTTLHRCDCNKRKRAFIVNKRFKRRCIAFNPILHQRMAASYAVDGIRKLLANNIRRSTLKVVLVPSERRSSTPEAVLVPSRCLTGGMWKPIPGRYCPSNVALTVPKELFTAFSVHEYRFGVRPTTCGMSTPNTVALWQYS
jgi:hypothetical protein